MSRFSLNEMGIARCDEYLARIADKADAMTSEQAERFFDGEWQRISRIRTEDPGSRTKEEFSAALLGIAVMRSMARVWKETHQ